MHETAAEGRIRRLFIERQAPERSGGCFDPEVIWDAARGELGPEQTGTIVDHTAGCAACAEAWRLAVGLTGAAPAKRPRSYRKRGLPRRFALAAAAAGLLLVAIGLPLITRGGDPSPTYRGPQSSALVATLPDGAALPRDAFDLSFTGGPPGTVYRLTVSTLAGDPIYEIEGLEQPRCRVPASALAELADGDEVAWFVVGVTPRGEKLESALGLARVRTER